jgi:hypothetical protein
MFSHENTHVILGWAQILKMYLQDYFLIQLVLYFPTYLPTYISK